jgi:hypothetical protein
MLHEILIPYLDDLETVSLGPMVTQPYCVLDFHEQEIAYIDIGKIDIWSEGICGNEYAQGLKNLLDSYGAKLMVDESSYGLVVEIPAIPDLVDAETLAQDFLREYNALFE